MPQANVAELTRPAPVEDVPAFLSADLTPTQMVSWARAYLYGRIPRFPTYEAHTINHIFARRILGSPVDWCVSAVLSSSIPDVHKFRLARILQTWDVVIQELKY